MHNLHGLPGIIGALGGAISAATASDRAYGSSIGLVTDDMTAAGIEPGDGLSASEQASVQVAALFITLGFAIVGGTIVGMIIKHPSFLPPSTNHPEIKEYGKSSNRIHHYDDKVYWETPEEGDEEANDEEEALVKEHTLEMVKLEIKRQEERRKALEDDLKILGTGKLSSENVDDNDDNIA